MFVLLHGMPGDADRRTAHEIREFQDTITVRCAAVPGIDVARAIGYTATSMFGPNGIGPTEHELTFRFTHHDGTQYHYEFTGLIDGA